MLTLSIYVFLGYSVYEKCLDTGKNITDVNLQNDLKFPLRLNSMKSSQAISRVSMELMLPMKMVAETVSETPNHSSILIWLIAQEDTNNCA